VAIRPVIVVHAGAGDWLTGVNDAVAACRRAAKAGMDVLGENGQATDGVVAAVRVLEDDPACNAGTGAVLTSSQTLELDACVMDGSSGASGAVGALPPFKHPIDIARHVMNHGQFHLLVGSGAAEFAISHGFNPAGQEDMIVRRNHPDAHAGNTVGAIALDSAGHLAAGTSTGGVSGKPPGRLGDTPIVGAGTYADHQLACSFTGEGESIARACAAFWTVEHPERDLDSLAASSLMRLVDHFGGRGGLIILRNDGALARKTNMKAMPHCYGILGHGFSFRS
jgi:beta-aspartyl-peptidase (threonine type)